MVGSLEYDPVLAGPESQSEEEGPRREGEGEGEGEGKGEDAEGKAGRTGHDSSGDGGEGSGDEARVQHRAFLRDSVVFKEVVPIQARGVIENKHSTDDEPTNRVRVYDLSHSRYQVSHAPISVECLFSMTLLPGRRHPRQDPPDVPHRLPEGRDTAARAGRRHLRHSHLHHALQQRGTVG